MERDKTVGDRVMSNARTEVDKVSLESIVAEWFFQRGMKISSVEIKPVGDDGDWEIGEATRRAAQTTMPWQERPKRSFFARSTNWFMLRFVVPKPLHVRHNGPS
jgi:hypothetical protein